MEHSEYGAGRGQQCRGGGCFWTGMPSGYGMPGVRTAGLGQSGNLRVRTRSPEGELPLSALGLRQVLVPKARVFNCDTFGLVQEKNLAIAYGFCHCLGDQPQTPLLFGGDEIGLRQLLAEPISDPFRQLPRKSGM